MKGVLYYLLQSNIAFWNGLRILRVPEVKDLPIQALSLAADLGGLAEAFLLSRRPNRIRCCRQ